MGDSVYGSVYPAFVEYVQVECEQVGRFPSSLNFTQAASLPVAALTGLEALHRAGAPWKSSPTVLVIGGSSGTGHLGIQLAKAMGAGRVVTTCSRNNFNFVQDLGADQVIDYHTQDWWKVLAKGSVDVIYDCIGVPGSAEHAYETLAYGGKYIQIYGKLADSKISESRPDVEQQNFIMSQSSTKYLDQISEFVHRGVLQPKILRTYNGLKAVPDVYSELVQGHVVGKLAVRI